MKLIILLLLLTPTFTFAQKIDFKCFALSYLAINQTSEDSTTEKSLTTIITKSSIYYQKIYYF